MIEDANIVTASQIVTSATDMACLLRAACPERARDFAMAAHERACWAFDDSRTLFWEQVVSVLSDEAETVVQVAA